EGHGWASGMPQDAGRPARSPFCVVDAELPRPSRGFSEAALVIVLGTAGRSVPASTFAGTSLRGPSRLASEARFRTAVGGNARPEFDTGLGGSGRPAAFAGSPPRRPGMGAGAGAGPRTDERLDPFAVRALSSCGVAAADGGLAPACAGTRGSAGPGRIPFAGAAGQETFLLATLSVSRGISTSRPRSLESPGGSGPTFAAEGEGEDPSRSGRASADGNFDPNDGASAAHACGPSARSRRPTSRCGARFRIISSQWAGGSSGSFTSSATSLGSPPSALALPAGSLTISTRTPSCADDGCAHDGRLDRTSPSPVRLSTHTDSRRASSPTKRRPEVPANMDYLETGAREIDS